MPRQLFYGDVATRPYPIQQMSDEAQQAEQHEVRCRGRRHFRSRHHPAPCRKSRSLRTDGLAQPCGFRMATGLGCPQRDSNPRCHLERVVTWAASRWGRPSEDTGVPSYHPTARAVSSAGRAPALHAGGRRFESCTAHFEMSCDAVWLNHAMRRRRYVRALRLRAVLGAVLDNRVRRTENSRPGDPQLANSVSGGPCGS